MEPQIQYVQTSDGINIAYYAIGQGPAQLTLLLPPSHLEAEWQVERLRMTYTATAQVSTLIRLDPRGFGLSDRNPPDFSVDGIVRDVETVIGHLGVKKLRIFAYGAAAVPALVYAARHPEIVTHLVQTPPMASGSDFVTERVEKILELAKDDMDLSTDIITRLMNPGEDEQFIKMVSETLGPAAMGDTAEVVRFMEEAARWNADAEARSLNTPTLLIHLRNSKAYDIAKTRRVAGLMPNSRLLIVDNLFEGILRTREFYQGTLDSTQTTSPLTERVPEPPASRTILFSDLVGHSEMMSRLGDDRGRQVLREHERITREVLRDHGGSEVKTMGDGFMASFSSATRAVQCACSLQRAFAEHEGEPLSIRVGINAGEPIEEDGDLFGATVILASRIAAKAEGGEILVADTVRGLCSGKGFLFNDRGDFIAKGFEEPVRVYEVSWRE